MSQLFSSDFITISQILDTVPILTIGNIIPIVNIGAICSFQDISQYRNKVAEQKLQYLVIN